MCSATSSQGKRLFSLLGWQGTLIIGFLAVIMIILSVGTGNPAPGIVGGIFLAILVGFFLAASRPGAVIGYPDRPRIAGPGGRPEEAPGTRFVPILRDQCQYKGCKNHESLRICPRCHRTLCPYHLTHHPE